MITYSTLKNNIEKEGYVELKNFIKKKQLLILKKFVKKKLKENKNQYFFLTSKNKEKTILHNDFFFKNIANLLKKLTIAFGEKIKKKEKLYKVLRVVTVKKSKKVSLYYHFDAHLLTLLIPIYIPKRKNSNNGNLIIFKNLRRLTKNIYKNIIQKIFYQSFFFKIFFINTNLIKGKILNLVPGNIYIFNGFRTLHTNLQINPIDIRATILVHYHDIFIDSYLVKKNREIRIQNEIKNIKKNKIT